MPDVQYRAVLDATDVLLKIAQVENKLLGIPQRAPIVFRVNDTAAKASLTNIEQRLKRLGTGNSQRITITLGSSRTSTDPLIGQLAQAERELRRLTLASAGTLGMTQRLGGIFGFLPGPIGLYASAASTLRGSLTGLNAAQTLNTVGAFALATGLTAIGTSVAALASHGIKQLGEFQAAVNTLNAQGEGLGNGFDARIRDLQSSGGRVAQQFNRAELGTGAADLTKQGLQEADAMKVLATSYRLAGAEGQNLLESSTLLLANLRQFGFDGPAAAAEAAHFGDVLAKGSLQAASGAKELQIGLSVVGPAAHAMGLSLEETIGYLVAMDNAGLKASTIGANAFRAVLLALASPTGVAAREIDKLGVALKNADGSARPVRDVLIDLRKAAKISGQAYDENTQAAVRSADTVSAVSSIFRSRGVVGFLNMTDAVDKYTDGLNTSEGALNQYATSLTEGPAKAQERLRKSVDDLALSFAQTFGPKLTEGLDFVTKSFRSLDELAQNPGAIKAYLEALATGIGAVTLAMTLNSKAAAAMFAADALGGVGKLVSGGVLGGLFGKLALGVKDLSTAFGLVARGGGISGVLQLLAAIPVAAGAALAGIALLAGGVAVYGAKIGGDIQAIYGQIDSDADKHQQQLLARVAELRKQGPLGRLQAQQALTIELRYNVENSAERNAELDATLLKLKGQIQAERDHQAALLASKKAKHTDVLATAEQQDAYDGLLTRLSDLGTRFGEVKTTSFQKNLQDARKSLEEFNAEVDKQASKGELTPTQAAGLKKRAAAAQPDLIASLTTRQLEEDRKTLVGFQRETDQVRLSLIKDGRAKRQEEYEAEVTALREKYGPEIRDALTNAQAKGLTPSQRRSLQEGAGDLQQQQNRALLLARKKLNDDLDQLDEDRAVKVRNAATAGLAQTASEMEGNTKILQTEYTRQVELVSTSVADRLVAERRLAPLLEAQRGEARQARLTADRAAARNEYDDAVRAARDQGAARSRLEEEARTAYLSKSRVLEQAYQDDVEGYHRDTLKAIQEAGAAVTKRQLDFDLKSIDTWTGAQLAAYTRMLEAKKASALADGDVAKAKVLSEALQTIADQNFSNLSSFKKDVAESVKGLEDLRGKLADLNPNKDPRRAAQSSAANPYNSVIAEAGKQKTGLDDAFGKLTPEQQRAQLASYQGQQRALDALVLDANRQRNTAILVADQTFSRERQDKAQASALKLAKTEYERTRDSGPYLVALEQDRAFWAARILITKEGSQDRATAEQQLADNATARKATLDGDRQLSDQRRQMTRDEVEGALGLAKTDEERTLRRSRLLALDRQRLADLPAEIAAATARGDTEEQVNTLKREQIALQGTIRTLEGDEVAQGEQRRQQARDELEGALGLAKTDEERSALRGELLVMDRERLAALPGEIAAARARGDSEDKINGLKREQFTLQGGIRTLQEAEVAQADQRRQFARDEVVGALELARTDTERVALRAQLRDLDQQRLAALPGEIAAAQARGATEEQVNALKREQLALGLSLQQARDGEVQRTDELLTAQLRVQAAQTGYAEAIARSNAEVVAAKQQSILDSQTDLADLDRRIAQAHERGLTDVQVQDLIADRLQKQTSLYGQQRTLREYLASLDRSALALLESQVALQQRLSGAVNDPLASKAAEIASTRRALEQNGRELADQNASEEDRVKLQITRNGLLGDEITQQRELVQLEFQRRQSALALAQAQQQVALKLSGLGDDAVASAELDLDLARQRLASKNAELSLAGAQGQGETALNGLRKEAVELTGQIYDAEKKVNEAVRQRADLLVEVGRAQQVLRQVLADQLDGSGDALDLGPVQQQLGVFQDRLVSAQINVARLQGEVSTATQKYADSVARFGGDGDATQFVALTLSKNQLTRANYALAQSELSAQVYQKLSASLGASVLATQEAQARHMTGILLPALRGEQAARRAVADATVRYGEALVAYNQVPQSTATMEKLKSAPDAVTSAIQNQRSALKAVADAYRSQISAMDNVRSAGEALNKAAYGDEGMKFDSGRELDRFYAIEKRRRQAIKDAQDALASGDAERIAKTTNDLATLEERYRKQGKLLEAGGVGVSLADVGAVRSIADQVDKLGIQYDRESVGLLQRAKIADQESRAVSEFGAFVAQFEAAVAATKANAGQLYYDGQWFASQEEVERYSQGKAQMAPVTYKKTPAPPTTPSASSTPDIAAAVQAAVQALAKANPTPAVQPPTPTSGPVNNSRTITIHKTTGPITVNARTDADPGEIGRAVRDELARVDREAEVYGECP